MLIGPRDFAAEEISPLPWSSSPTKLWHLTCRYLGMTNCVQGYGGTASLKFGRAKFV